MRIFRLLLLLVFTISSFSASTIAQTASTDIVFSGFQACGGCTVCGADYWCFNTPGSYCGNTGPSGSQSFSDPVPPGNIVTSVTVDYYSAGCAGGSINVDINGQAIPGVFDGNTGCLCSNNPCAVAATSSQTFPCGLPGYNNGGSNTLNITTGSSVCINRLHLTFTYAPADQAVPAFQPGTISGPSEVCAGSQATYSISSVSNATGYTWSVPAGWSIVSGQNSTSITVTAGSTSGNICVLATNLCGSSAQNCAAITAVPIINASISNVDNCAGDVSIQISGGIPSISAATYNFTNNGAGTLTGLPVSNNGTVTISNLVANDNWNITINDGACTSTFNGSFLGDIVDPVITNCPSNQNLDITSGCDVALPDYTSLITVSDDCTPSSAIQITQNPTPGTIVSGHGTIQTVTLSADDGNGNSSTCSFDVTLSDVTDPTIVTCPNDQNLAIISNCEVAIPDYTSSFSATDNCTLSGSILVTQLPSPGTLLSGAGTVQNVTITADDGNGNTSDCNFEITIVDNENPTITCPSDISQCNPLVTWTDPVGIDNCAGVSTVQTAGDPSGSLFSTGIYTIEYTATDGSGNISTCSFNIDIQTQEDASFQYSDTLYCTDDSNPSPTVTGVQGGEFTISPSGTINSTTGELDIQATGPGTYTVFYNTTIVGNLCPGIDSTSITISPMGSITGTGISEICLGDTATLIVSNSGIGNVIWYQDEQGLNPIDTGNIINPITNSIDTFYYYVNEDGVCPGPIVPVILVVNGIDMVVSASPEEGTAPLNVTFGNQSVGTGVNYYWDFDNNSTSTDPNPSTTYNESGTYTIVVTATDTNNCVDSTYLTIVVRDDYSLSIPNVFTPNGDGSNDIFKVSGTNIIEFNGVILNRWGQILYEWDFIDSGWDGRMTSGIDASDGTYFYIINVTDGHNISHEESGTLNLIR